MRVVADLRMKKKFFKATLAVAAIATVGLGSYEAYGSYTAANTADNDLLIAENVLALADGRPGWWDGLVDPCVKNFTATPSQNVYGSSSSSSSSSNSHSSSVGVNANPATGTVGGDISTSSSNSNSNTNEGNYLIGQVVDCSGFSWSHCHMGDCTKYENGSIVPKYPDCKKFQ